MQKMKMVKWGASEREVPAIVVGCMRMNSVPVQQVEELIKTALEKQVNFFDHADIYGGGECERIFAEAFKRTGAKREDIFLQSKCGIVPGVMFDFSKKHIIESVEGSLRRLNTEYLDSLLLHRPDALMEPEEVAAAFDELETSGKVRYFGVSNQTPAQMELLKKCVKQPLMADQLQFGIAHATMISSGIEANMKREGGVDRDGGVLDYCRLHDITIQAWSPFQYGMFEGVFLNNEKFPELNQKIDEIAERYHVANTTIAVAWILRHPANMQVLSGTMTRSRFEDICKAAEICLTRQEWYEIYRAAGNILP